jgi:maleamate amidohydrolase
VAVWDKYLTEQDRDVFQQGGFGKRQGFGRRPALLVVDVNYAFCGERSATLLEAIAGARTACGPAAWAAVDRIRPLLDAVRRQAVPVFFSTGLRSGSTSFDRGRWNDKSTRSGEDRGLGHGLDIVDEIAPLPHEIVIAKNKPSMFFGTGLVSHLVDLGVDTLIIVGVATSGCVRGTAVDGFSYNFRVSVVEECVFDRGEATHALNLFDIQQKYGDVVTLDETLDYVAGLPDDLFVERLPILAEVRDRMTA